MSTPSPGRQSRRRDWAGRWIRLSAVWKEGTRFILAVNIQIWLDGTEVDANDLARKSAKSVTHGNYGIVAPTSASGCRSAVGWGRWSTPRSVHVHTHNVGGPTANTGRKLRVSTHQSRSPIDQSRYPCPIRASLLVPLGTAPGYPGRCGRRVHVASLCICNRLGSNGVGGGCMLVGRVAAAFTHLVFHSPSVGANTVRLGRFLGVDRSM
jgi:hypothetical protein